MGSGIGGFMTIVPCMTGRGENGQIFMRQRQLNAVSEHPRYQAGHDCLVAKRPDDLPRFFQQIGALVLGRRLSGTKGRSLLRNAVHAVGDGVGMSYRLRPGDAVFLKSSLVPDTTQWVALEARKLTAKLRRGREPGEGRGG